MIVHARGSPCTACVCVCGSCLAPIQQQDCGLKCCVLRLQPVVGAWLLEHAALAGTYNAGWEGLGRVLRVCYVEQQLAGWKHWLTCYLSSYHTHAPHTATQSLAPAYRCTHLWSICSAPACSFAPTTRASLLHAALCEKQPHSFLLLEAVVVIL